jgi:FAD/FMN-containing dehydrogenase
MAAIRAGSRTSPARDDGTGELVAALRRAGLSDVSDRTVDRAAYSSDASAFRVVPAAVARPRDAAETEAALAVCREAGVPVTARGAGTSIAGNAVGTGLVLDFSRHMNRVLDVDAGAMTATVQPGVVQAGLHRQLPDGLRFGPDPSSHTRCTIGGMIGNNACGSRALRYGRTVDNVLALDVLTAAGAPLRITGPAGPTTGGEAPEPAALRRITAGYPRAIRTELGRFGRQVSGYALEHLLPENGFDVRRALVGSEGTLALLTQATLRLVREPACRVLAVAGYPDMASAADAAPGFTAHQPTACEGLDSRITDVVRAQRGAGAVDALPPGSGWLFAEFAAGTAAEAGAMARRALASAATGATGTLLVTDPRQAAALWRIREDGAGFAGLPDGQPPTRAGRTPPCRRRAGPLPARARGAHAAVPLTGLPYGTSATGACTCGSTSRWDGPTAPDHARFMTDAARLVARYGGSLSGEHGDGRTAASCCPSCTHRPSSTCSARSRRPSTPADAEPGSVGPRPLDADLRARAAAKGPPARHREAGPWPTATITATSARPCTGARGRQVPRRPDRQRRRDVPSSWRPGTRSLHPRPGPGAAGDGHRHAGHRRLAGPGRDGALDLCLARACGRNARPGWTWPATRPRCSTRPTGWPGRGRTTRSAGCPGGPAGLAGPARPAR